MHAAFQANRTQDQYRRAIAGKTAALMATSCRIGALTGGLPRPQVEAFTSFGRSFGMIFQVRDDILDVIGTEAELGKPAGQDLAEGVYTLPVLLALADPVAGPELSPLLGQPLGQPERDKARSIVAESGAIEDSVVVARRFAEEAVGRRRRSLTRAGRRFLPPGPLAGRRPSHRLSGRGRGPSGRPGRGRRPGTPRR